MNTASLRSKAYNAEQEKNWVGAAALYQQALDAYPAHHAGSQFSQADKKSLADNAKSCARMAAQLEKEAA